MWLIRLIVKQKDYLKIRRNEMKLPQQPHRTIMSRNSKQATRLATKAQEPGSLTERKSNKPEEKRAVTHE